MLASVTCTNKEYLAGAASERKVRGGTKRIAAARAPTAVLRGQALAKLRCGRRVGYRTRSA